MNRKNENDFEEISDWLRSERPPFTDEDRAAMRRAVWREIEARRQPEGGFRPARLVLAGTALLAAVLVAVLWLRPPASAPLAPVLAAVTRDPATVAEAVQRPPAEESPRPPATGHARPNVRRRLTEPEGVPVRIEFQTANPEVRIIWLVNKGEAAPRPSSSSRHQEVS
jgi:hypothetical protein